jgi:hypothetical protein
MKLDIKLKRFLSKVLKEQIDFPWLLIIKCEGEKWIEEGIVKSEKKPEHKDMENS